MSSDAFIANLVMLEVFGDHQLLKFTVDDSFCRLRNKSQILEERNWVCDLVLLGFSTLCARPFGTAATAARLTEHPRNLEVLPAMSHVHIQKVLSVCVFVAEQLLKRRSDELAIFQHR